MGILNLTKDSFFDGGKYNNLNSAIAHTQKMLDEGAYFIDIGVSSSKPGSLLISPEEERNRLIPLLKVLLKEFNAALKKGALDDDEIFGLLNEMSPLQRYFQTIKYRVHAHKYRKIVELQAEQVKKAKYRNTAGMNAADLERERAAAEDAGTYTKTESTDTDEDEEDLKNTCPECNGSGELNLQGENFTTIVRCENCWGYGDMEIYERVRKEHEEWLNADERSNTCKMCDGDREIEVTINDISHKVPCPECQVNDER